MEIHFQQDFLCLNVLPTLTLQGLQCDCGGDNGSAVLIGWFFWTLVFHFNASHTHNE